MLNNIRKRKWEFFTEPQGEQNEVLVREFYATYAASFTKEQARRRAYLSSITVRGVEVSCVPTTFNYFYFENWDRGMTEFDAKMVRTEDERSWVASVRAQGTLAQIELGQKIQKKDLTQEGWYWLDLFCSRIQQTKNETDISIEKAILIASIMSGFKIYVGKLIFPKII